MPHYSIRFSDFINEDIERQFPAYQPNCNVFTTELGFDGFPSIDDDVLFMMPEAHQNFRYYIYYRYNNNNTSKLKFNIPKYWEYVVEMIKDNCEDLYMYSKGYIRYHNVLNGLVLAHGFGVPCYYVDEFGNDDIAIDQIVKNISKINAGSTYSRNRKMYLYPYGDRTFYGTEYVTSLGIDEHTGRRLNIIKTPYKPLREKNDYDTDQPCYAQNFYLMSKKYKKHQIDNSYIDTNSYECNYFWR